MEIMQATLVYKPLVRIKRKFNKILLAKFLWWIARFIIIVGLSFLIIYPLIFRFSVSIRSNADMYDPTVTFIPKNPTFINYSTLLDALDYPKVFTCTFLFTILISFLQIVSCILVAYGLARFKFKGNTLLFIMAIVTMVVPPQTMLMPIYLRFKYFNLLTLFKFTGALYGVDLTNSMTPFILLSITASGFKNGLYIFLLRQYFKNIPYILEEAAYIDGCGPLKTFVKIMVPGALPMILSVFLLSFVWQWNDDIYTGILGGNLPLLTNELFELKFNNFASSDLLQSMMQTPKFFLLTIPLILIYIFTQRFFTESIERSGIVG